MKKCFFLFGLCFILSACYQNKKDRLTSDTLVIAIDPTFISISTGTAKDLKALCRSAKSDNLDISPEWTVDPSNLGSFSSSRGKTTTFTASALTVGLGKIYASYSGIRGSINVNVSSAAPAGGGSGGGSGGGTSTTYYGLYSETYVSPTYSALKYDTANPPDTDGGCMGSWGGGTISDETGAGNFNEGSHALKCVIGGAAGGWWLQFGSDAVPTFTGDAVVAKNMSAFSGGSIRFDIKTTKDTTVKIEWTGGSKEFKVNVDLGVTLDNAWHPVTVPLSSFTGIDLTKIEKPAGFHSADTNYTYYIDNVRWEK